MRRGGIPSLRLLRRSGFVPGFGLRPPFLERRNHIEYDRDAEFRPSLVQHAVQPDTLGHVEPARKLHLSGQEPNLHKRKPRLLQERQQNRFDRVGVTDGPVQAAPDGLFPQYRDIFTDGGKSLLFHEPVLHVPGDMQAVIRVLRLFLHGKGEPPAGEGRGYGIDPVPTERHIKINRVLHALCQTQQIGPFSIVTEYPLHADTFTLREDDQRAKTVFINNRLDFFDSRFRVRGSARIGKRQPAQAQQKKEGQG